MKGEGQITFDAGLPNPAIEAWKKNGGKVVGTICCHVPEEIIHAAGLLPVRLRGTGCTDDSEAEVWMSSWSCSFVRACTEYILNGTFDFLDGLVCSDGCIMAQRIFDNAGVIKKGLYQQLVLAPRLNQESSVRFYREELQTFKEGMEKLSGNTVTEEKLKKSIELYNETRRLIQALYALRKADAPVISGAECLNITLASMSMPKEIFNQKLGAFLREAETRRPITGFDARLMVLGSALDDPAYIKVIEDKGGLVVTDIQCYGSRYLWEPVVLSGGDVLADLAGSYLSRPVCPRMTAMHGELYDLMRTMVSDYKVDGVVFARMKNCDMWAGETIYIEGKFKRDKIPLLTLEREEIMTNVGQLAVRAEAFIEMLEGRAGE
jgi:bzd-type benzoyl-CoA reductase N subunit